MPSKNEARRYLDNYGEPPSVFINLLRRCLGKDPIEDTSKFIKPDPDAYLYSRRGWINPDAPRRCGAK